MTRSLKYNKSRRKFLLGSAALATYFAIAPYSYASALEETSRNLKLARFLTNKAINPDVASRAFDALSKINNHFQAEAKSLTDYIDAQQFNNVEALKTDALFNQKYKSTAMTIISAFYLGYVGSPQDHVADDGVQFVTYLEIETFRLTKDFTPIPGFSNHKTNYWVSLPRI